jgi:hypothetical protein
MAVAAAAAATGRASKIASALRCRPRCVVSGGAARARAPLLPLVLKKRNTAARAASGNHHHNVSDDEGDDDATALLGAEVETLLALNLPLDQVLLWRSAAAQQVCFCLMMVLFLYVALQSQLCVVRYQAIGSHE